MEDRVRKLWSDRLTGNVELLVPGEDGIKAEEWLIKHAKEAAVIAFLYEPPGLPKRNEEQGCRGEAGNGVRTCRIGETPIVSVDSLRRLPTNTRIIWAVLASTHRTSAPAQLTEFSSYDLSDQAEEEAFLCRLAHDPVHSRQTLHAELRNDFCLVVIAGVATALNQVEAVREHLRRLFPESVVTTVHWVMLCLVAAAFAWGVWRLMRVAWRSLRAALPFPRLFEEGRRRMILSVGAFIVLLTIALISLHRFTRLPSIDELASQERERMVRKLERAFAREGGIRAHTQEKAIQVWTTAQGLNGLLSCRPATEWSTNTPDEVRRSFEFIDHTTINPLRWKTNGQERFVAALTSDGTGPVTPDFTKLPPQFPTLTMALNVMRKELGELAGPTNLLTARAFREYFDPVESRPPIEGWGYFEQMDWGVTEVAAWVALAHMRSLDPVSPAVWLTEREREESKQRIRWIINLLERRQMQSGGFIPISGADEPDYARTYSTIMAVWAMDEALSCPVEIFSAEKTKSIREALERGLAWLSRSALVYHRVGEGQNTIRLTGWKVDPSNPRDEVLDGLTMQTLWIASRAAAATKTEEATLNRLDQIKQIMIEEAEGWMNRSMASNPRMHDSDGYLYPTTRILERSTFLWYPWTLALLREVSADPKIKNTALQKRATYLYRRLLGRAAEFGEFAAGTGNEYNYVAAEGIIGISWPQRGGSRASN